MTISLGATDDSVLRAMVSVGLLNGEAEEMGGGRREQSKSLKKHEGYGIRNESGEAHESTEEGMV